MSAIPDYIVTTGDFIAEWMEEEGISAAELSRRLGVSRKHMSELLRGKAPLSQAVALKLEPVTGIPARLWNRYEAGYREDLARLEADKTHASEYEEAKAFPLAYLRKCGHITASGKDQAETVRQLLTFLGVSSLASFWETWSHGAVAYRRSAAARENTPKLAVWLTAGEHRGEPINSFPNYDESQLREQLSRLRGLTVEDPYKGISKAKEVLARCGVILRLVPAVSGLGIHGATRWIQDRPLIQLSLLWKRDDQMWFTLFHEIGHILLHDPRGLYLSVDKSEKEREADAFAANLLIPEEHESRIPRKRDVAGVKALAKDLGIAPSIVLGRAQREIRDYTWGNILRRRVELPLASDLPTQEKATTSG